MAVTTTPMSQYNKSNPLVILSKKQYSAIMDSIQNLSKGYLQRTIPSVIFVVIFLFLEVIYGILAHVTYMKGFELGAVFVILCLINFGYYLRWRSLTEHFLHRHEAMTEFDRISGLELNDILMIGNEEVLGCLHKMYEMSGELSIEKKYFFLGGDFLILLNAVVVCVFIPISNITGLIFGGV